MADQAVEYDEYYEEVVSYYDTGLSTILEGDNESCADSITSLEALQQPRRSITQVPNNIDLSPKLHSSMRSLSMDSSPMSLVSPLEGRRYLSASMLRSPSMSARKSPFVTNLPLTLTNFSTGEELMIEDDDEYTFVSCSDTESLLGASFSNMDDGFYDGELLSCDLSSFSSPGRKSSSRSMRSSEFESTKRQLANALANRRKVDRIDGFQRKLRYDLQRKMFKEQMSRWCTPPEAEEKESNLPSIISL